MEKYLEKVKRTLNRAAMELSDEDYEKLLDAVGEELDERKDGSFDLVVEDGDDAAEFDPDEQ